MDDSMAQPGESPSPAELPAWKNTLGLVAGVLLAAVFLVSGVWKILDPLRAAALMTQALVPHLLSLPAALAFGVAETVAAVLLVVPRHRRWGALLATLMLVSFLLYFAIFYGQLRGQDCNCFPWVKRAVGPAFFISDAVMLLAALVAGWWARPSQGSRNAAVIAGAVTVFALLCWGMTAVRQQGVKAPDVITVDGQPYSLQYGRIFLYFFHPECAHCDVAARAMSRYNWGETKVVAVVWDQAQFAGQFLRSTGLRAGLTTDLQVLQEAFSVPAYPAGVALEHGRMKANLTVFEGQEPEATLKKLGFVY